MNILFASSEVFPFAKTGGLADVMGALPEALSKRGHRCSIILPYYKCVKEKNFSPKLFKKDVTLKINNKNDLFDLYLLKHGNVDVYFVEKDEYYDRAHLYNTPQGDYPDNALRFGFFAKAILASISCCIGRQDVLHCNDWQSALIPLYIKLLHKDDKNFIGTKTLFTIHNMAYQGVFDRKFMEPLGIPGDLFVPKGLEFYGKINFMKAGLIYSDAIGTVSEGYSREILTPEFGCGLDVFLRTRKKDLYGIVNGVDYSVWNPETDKFIIERYSKKDLSGKRHCKEDLLQEFHIEGDTGRPLVGMITRLAEQKGIDLVSKCMADILRLKVDFVILGFGEEKYNALFSDLAKKYKGRVGAKIGFDNALAHKIEAGCDIFLMPSKYEPCGLNQLYSLKYATVPVVRAVGGLDDTVTEFDPSTEKGNGFKFKKATRKALLKELDKAIHVYKNKKLWNILLHNGLSCDFSWDSSAEKYERLYNKLTTIP